MIEKIEKQKSGNGSLVGSLLIIVAISLYVFFGKGLAEENSKVATAFMEKESQLSTYKDQEKVLQEAEKELGITSQVEQHTSINAVPTEIDQDGVIRTVVEIAESFDIVLSSINFAKSGTEMDSVDSLRINASFEGNYVDLIDFLEGLEQNERLFKVNNISVQINRLSFSGLERANFSLTIDTYYQK